MKGEDIADRLMELAIASVRVATRIERTATGKHIARQLVRCATSGGANYAEARSAESRADFIHKIGIAAKEVRETAWWLTIADRTGLDSPADSSRWIKEATELVAILTASARTARRNTEPTPETGIA